MAWTGLRNRPFLTCAGLLVLVALCAGPLATQLGAVLRKEPVPLRQPLDKLDKTALGEYTFVRAYYIASAVIASLGTDLYIDWEFQDDSVTDRQDPLRRARLFVTYYTGKPDQVPHTPDVCYYGSGYEIREAGNLTLNVHNANGTAMRIPGRAVTFEKTSVQRRDRPTVVYTFHCNGEFVATRKGVLRKLGSLRDRGAYYCKVEVRFGQQESQALHADREATIRAAEKFLDRVVPVLLRDHLPDWDAVQRGETAKAQLGQS